MQNYSLGKRGYASALAVWNGAVMASHSCLGLGEWRSLPDRCRRLPTEGGASVLLWWGVRSTNRPILSPILVGT